jgi:hypothetical protein
VISQLVWRLLRFTAQRFERITRLFEKMDADAKFITLERIRSTIALLKKSNVSNELVVVSHTACWMCPDGI